MSVSLTLAPAIVDPFPVCELELTDEKSPSGTALYQAHCPPKLKTGGENPRASGGKTPGMCMPLKGEKDPKKAFGCCKG